MSGAIADYRRQRGYIVPAHGTIRIDGFRRSLDVVATFRFSDPRDSYSARLGTQENVGVIGVAFFRERAERYSQPLRPPYRREDAPAAAPRGAETRGDAAARRKSSAAPGAANHLGTEFGETRDNRVREVGFERRTRDPDSLVTLRYDDAAGLRARGIDLEPLYDRSEPDIADPFPANRFAAPPPPTRRSGCTRRCDAD